MAAKMCRTPLRQIQMVPAGDTSLVETSSKYMYNATWCMSVHGSVWNIVL